MADNTPTLESIQGLLNGPEVDPGVEGSAYDRGAAERRAKEETESVGFWDAAKTAAKREWIPVAAARSMAAMHGTEYDPDFSIADMPEEELKMLFDGLPDDVIPRLHMAQSKTHLYALVDQTREALAMDEKLDTLGGWGVALRFGAAMTDPAAILLATTTGGIGASTKAERLLRAGQAASRAGKRAQATRVLDKADDALNATSPTKKALAIATATAVESAALESILVGADPTRDGWDVVMAAIAGGGLGFGLGRWLSGREANAVRRSITQERRIIEAEELMDAAEKVRAKAAGAMGGDVASVRAAVESLEESLGNYKGRVDVRNTTADDIRARLDNVEEVAAQRASLTETAARAPKGAKRSELKSTIKRLEAEAKRIGDSDPKAAATIQRGLRAAQEDLEKLSKADEARKGLEDLDSSDAARAAAEDDMDDLKEALGLREQIDELEPKRAELRRYDDAERVAADALAARSVAQKTPGDRAGFDDDTLSAARAVGITDELHPFVRDYDHKDVGQKAFNGFWGNLFGATFSSVLQGSNNKAVRDAVGLLVGNSVGTKDGSVVHIGASERRQAYLLRAEARFNSAVLKPYEDWAKEQGYGMAARTTRPVREEFMEAVGRFISDPADPEVPAPIRSAGAQIRAQFREHLRALKEAGVKGFENVEFNDYYLPRVFHPGRFKAHINMYGEDQIVDLFASAFIHNHRDLDPKVARKVARGYINTLRDSSVAGGDNLGSLAGLRFDDIEYLEEFLSDPRVKIDLDTATEIVEEFRRLNQRRNRQTEGNFRYAKHRLDYDEKFSMELKRTGDPNTGHSVGTITPTRVSVEDLLDRNVEALFQRYNRTVSGHIALAEVGIRSTADFNNRLKIVRNELEKNPRELKRVLKYANAARDLLTGKPIHDTGWWTNVARAGRDLQYTTVMNNVGWSQMPDFAALLGKGYLTETLRVAWPAIRAMKRSDNGRLAMANAREVEENLGIGVDVHNNAIFSAYHDAGDFAEALDDADITASGRVSRTLQKGVDNVGHASRVGSRITTAISGMGVANVLASRMASMAIVNRLKRDVLKGGAFSAKRRATLGIDEAMAKRIATQIKKHRKKVPNDHGGKSEIMDWVNWDDLEARDAMMFAVRREATRIVQNEDLGDTSLWMHTWWGKVIGQFRRFALVSYQRQVLYGLNHLDAEAMTQMMASATLAALSYMGMRHAQALTIADPQERKEFKERYLNGKHVAAAAFSRSSYASLFPGISDSVTSFLGDKRFFDTRSTGLDSTIVKGIPMVGYGMGVMDVAKRAWDAASRTDRVWDMQDQKALWRLVPLQNWLPLQAAHNYTFDPLLPDKDPKDYKPDEAEFIWE